MDLGEGARAACHRAVARRGLPEGERRAPLWFWSRAARGWRRGQEPVAEEEDRVVIRFKTASRLTSACPTSATCSAGSRTAAFKRRDRGVGAPTTMVYVPPDEIGPPRALGVDPNKLVIILPTRWVQPQRRAKLSKRAWALRHPRRADRPRRLGPGALLLSACAPPDTTIEFDPRRPRGHARATRTPSTTPSYAHAAAGST